MTPWRAAAATSVGSALSSRISMVRVPAPQTHSGQQFLGEALEVRGQPIPLAVTGVASVSQALIVGNAGADVVVLFNGPLDRASDTPVDLVGPVRAAYTHAGVRTRILSCGRFPRGVGEYAAAGSDLLTLKKEYLDLLYEHPYTDKRLAGFMADWAASFGDATWPQK
jgi:transaldolase